MTKDRGGFRYDSFRPPVDLGDNDMTFVPRQRVMVGQAKGPDVELMVEGDEWYATYETSGGHPAVYDDAAGLFCYARLIHGRFESTGVPVSQSPPADSAPPHAEEAASVKRAKVAAKEAQRASRTHRSEGERGPSPERRKSS